MCWTFCLKGIKNSLPPLTQIQKVLTDTLCNWEGENRCQAEEVICGMGMSLFSSAKDDYEGTLSA